ncbi:hypothetical protein MACJ_003154 [Theileria orientalis]|uniref:Uncharacterized protein n=1 Tax=Theileria orientalis TaxID=68886 RepID=A0A976M7D8_THEOR|nr:hypothetical protein MACJ_003154 [Theileria orientalis]
MANISHESLILSELNSSELKRIQSCNVYNPSDFDNSIVIDSYKEVPDRSLSSSRRRSSSVHVVYNEAGDEKDNDTTLSYIYKKLAAFFFVFNRFSFGDGSNIIRNSISKDNNHDISNDSPFFTNNIAPFVRSFSILYDLRLKDKIYDTVDYLIKYNRRATDRIVALFTNVPLNLDKFDFSKYLSNFEISLSESFALFIEQPTESDSTNIAALDDIPNDLKCEVVNKYSREVISESGPYHCVYEHKVDSIADNTILDEMLYGVAVKKGKLRFFQKIKSLTKKESDRFKQGSDESLNEYIKHRFATFTEYLSKRNQYSEDPNSNKWKPRTYFNVFSKKREESPSYNIDETARERFEEHVRVHTLHWDEVQYDDIEIVLRDNNDNSVVKLPYSCTIM